LVLEPLEKLIKDNSTIKCIVSRIMNKIKMDGDGDFIYKYGVAFQRKQLHELIDHINSVSVVGADLKFFLPELSEGEAKKYTNDLLLFKHVYSNTIANDCFQLGLDFAKKGTDQDLEKSLHYYQLAAAEGHAGAQHNLGMAYTYGRGVVKDCKQAFEWYLLAAAGTNDAATEYALALC